MEIIVKAKRPYGITCADGCKNRGELVTAWSVFAATIEAELLIPLVLPPEKEKSIRMAFINFESALRAFESRHDALVEQVRQLIGDIYSD